ncbi:GNAT family N-acetyltransferase [Hamadaea tsunoensis]|uniref:GNAT family N-acetyltransferase n=1 Tax=Hamadaea tsunoensis TaxID=53368 RepID=UPI000480007A|nr:GNAT family N-acetyltransferase [Hamadaea tsunoensis]
MTLVDPDARALAENHFAFMAAQRGTLRRTPDTVELAGRAEFLSWWTPLTESAEIPPSTGCVRVFPWNSSWASRLPDLGFREAGRLSYMTAPVRVVELRLPEGVVIEAVDSDEAAAVFAQTQAAGFADPGDSADDAAWWEELFRQVVVDNYDDPEQTFYLLRCDGTPAAVTLTVSTDHVTGVYAVATVPAYRRRGFANLLLQRVHEDAYAREDAWLTLQVEPGSDAERLYLAAGFTVSFASQLYARRVLDGGV